MPLVVELEAVDRLVADLRVLERAFHLRLLLPVEGDGDAAVRAYLTRPRDEARRQARPLEHALRPHRVLRGVERDHPAPLHALPSRVDTGLVDTGLADTGLADAALVNTGQAGGSVEPPALTRPSSPARLRGRARRSRAAPRRPCRSRPRSCRGSRRSGR